MTSSAFTVFYEYVPILVNFPPQERKENLSRQNLYGDWLSGLVHVALSLSNAMLFQGMLGGGFQLQECISIKSPKMVLPVAVHLPNLDFLHSLHVTLPLLW